MEHWFWCYNSRQRKQHGKKKGNSRTSQSNSYRKLKKRFLDWILPEMYHKKHDEQHLPVVLQQKQHQSSRRAWVTGILLWQEGPRVFWMPDVSEKAGGFATGGVWLLFLTRRWTTHCSRAVAYLGFWYRPPNYIRVAKIWNQANSQIFLN